MKKILVFLCLLITPYYVLTCSCNFLGEITIRDYNSIDVLFMGEVIAININKNEIYNKQKEIVFQVIDDYKGVETNIIKVYTSLYDSSCGLGVNDIGITWMIWAYYQNNELHTSLCTRSTKINFLKKDDFQLIKEFSQSKGFKIWYDSDGKKTGEGQLINHKANGYWKYYSKDFLIAEGNYKNSIQDSIWKEYYEPESVVMKLKYQGLISSNEKTDLMKYANRLMEVQSFKNGLRDSSHIRYNSDGTIFLMNTYKNGQKEGVEIYYYDNGIPWWIEKYKNDKRNGMRIIFYSNGIVQEMGEMQDDLPIGEWKAYNREGKLVCTLMNKLPEYDYVKKKFTCEN